MLHSAACDKCQFRLLRIMQLFFPGKKDCSTFALVEKKKGEWESNLYYLPSICGGTTS